MIAVFGVKQSPMSFGSLYALALVGSSVGFYLFLYFISIGYALGIALPLAVALARYCSKSPISFPNHAPLDFSTALGSSTDDVFDLAGVQELARIARQDCGSQPK